MKFQNKKRKLKNVRTKFNQSSGRSATFTAGFITAVRDYRKAERKKKQENKVAELQALWEDEIKAHDQRVIEEYNSQMALLRKASISDNDWGMAEVL